MKKDGVYYCMHKRDVMCAHAKERQTSIMKRLRLKFHDFLTNKPQMSTIFIDLARAINYRTTRLRNFSIDASLMRTNSRNTVINIKIPISRNTSLPGMT